MVPGLNDVKEISAGQSHLIILQSLKKKLIFQIEIIFIFHLGNGDLLSCGMNDYGQLGLGDYSFRTLPSIISHISGMDLSLNRTKFSGTRASSILVDRILPPVSTTGQEVTGTVITNSVSTLTTENSLTSSDLNGSENLKFNTFIFFSLTLFFLIV